MQQRRFDRIAISLLAIIMMVAALAILGCDDDGGGPDLPQTTVDATAANAAMLVDSWVFDNGQIINDNLANASTTVTFASSTTNDLAAVVSSAGGTAAAGVTIASCTFNYTTSTFTAGAGPQAGDTVTFNPCRLVVSSDCSPDNFDEDTTCQAALELTRGALTASSNENDVTVLVRESDGAILINGVATGLILEDGSITGSTGSTGSSGAN